jgi:putative flippase GtrA
MSRWRDETARVIRYACSGGLNTLLGFAVIFSLTWLGSSPFIANIAGYAVGLVVGFFVSKLFVFRSKKLGAGQIVKYLFAFVISYLANLWVLHLTLHRYELAPMLCQALAAFTYTAIMYVLSRYVVFDVSHGNKGA